jgi:predicted ArsR family transcriptional regulator
VARWHADQTSAEEARKSTKTKSVILTHISKTEIPQTPSSIAAALRIPRERAKKAMQRLAKAGVLVSTKSGYKVGK